MGQRARHFTRAATLLALLLGEAAAAQGSADAGTPAQAQPSLTLEEVLDSVARAYPSVASARAEEAAARAELLTARGGFDPEVKGRLTTFPTAPYEYTRVETSVTQPTPFWGASLFGGWRYGRGDIPVYYGNYETNQLGELRAGVSVPLWRNGPIDRRRAALAEAELGGEAASLAVAQALLEATRSAAQRYWEWVAAGRKLAVARALLDIALARVQQLSDRVRSGDVPRLELVDNERTLLQRQGGVVAAERQLQQAAFELSLYLRDAEGRPRLAPQAQLPTRLPEPVPLVALVGQPSLEEVLARRPDVRQLRARREQQRVEERLAQNQVAPAVDVTVAAAKDLGAGSAKLARPELELGLVVELPTFNRAARGKARGASASVAKLEAQLQLAQERAVADVRDAFSALEAARQRVALARQEVAVARELEEGERTRFALGDSTLLVVNLREQASAEAQVREVEALADYHKAVATLRAALALPVQQP